MCTILAQIHNFDAKNNPIADYIFRSLPFGSKKEPLFRTFFLGNMSDINILWMYNKFFNISSLELTIIVANFQIGG